jgi:hypothetical protein
MKIKKTDRVIIRTQSTNFSGDLKLDSKDYTHILLKAVSIPKTFFGLPTDSTITFSEDGVDKVLTFSKGNYNYRNFRSILQSKLNDSGWNYTVSLPNTSTGPDTLRYTIAVSGNSGVQPTFTTESTFLARMIGVLVDTTNTFESDSFESPFIWNFQSYDELVLKSNLVNTQDNIIAEIYSSDSPDNGSIIKGSSDLLIDMVKIDKSALNSGVATFTLNNIDGETVDLNGGYWSFILVFYEFDNSLEEAIKAHIRFIADLENLKLDGE